MDSDLRVALLAIWGSGDRRLAADFLCQSADRKIEAIAAAELTGGTGGALAPLARWYTDLRSATATALLAAESEAIRAMAEAQPRKLTGKPRRNTRPPKGQKRS
jgi:hypothetical protein